MTAPAMAQLVVPAQRASEPPAPHGSGPYTPESLLELITWAATLADRLHE